jgi:hypothetical protein
MALYSFFGPLQGPQRVERSGNIKQIPSTKIVYICACKLVDLECAVLGHGAVYFSM